MGSRMGGRGSSDGSRSIVSRQIRHRRFCRRSQLQNSRSQRRHVTYPAYGLSFGALRWGPFRFIDVLGQAQPVVLELSGRPRAQARWRVTVLYAPRLRRRQ